MKINSTVCAVIAISLVAIVSYYIGASRRVNPDQQSPLSNTLPIVQKQAKAVEAKPEPSVEKVKCELIATQQQQEDTDNTPVVIVGHSNGSDTPYTILDKQLKSLQDYYKDQQNKLAAQQPSQEEWNSAIANMQSEFDAHKFKLDSLNTQLKNIEATVKDPALANQAMWRLVLPPEHAAAMFPKSEKTEPSVEKVKRELIATQQQQEDLARKQQRQRQEMMNRLNEIERQQRWNDMERDNWQLKYNYLDKKWQYAPQNSQLRYNCLDNSWQYVPSR